MYEDLTFGNVKKKLHLSLLNGNEPEVVKWIAVLEQKADTDERQAFVDDLMEAIMTGTADDIKEMFK